MVQESADGWSYTMQHGDLTAWQIMCVEDTWIVFDGERSGDDLPRFNDVAYSYGRLAIRCGQPEAAEKLLRDFIQISELGDTKQLHGVILLRLLGMYGDSLRDGLNDECQLAEQLIKKHLHEVKY